VSRCLLFILLLVLGCGDDAPGAAPVAEAAPAQATGGDETRPFERSLGEGFVVWESNRTGDWRIWTRRLDGSGLRQFTADEPERQHCCPHLSPDGKWVAYLSFAGRKDKYPEAGIAGTLRLQGVDSRDEPRTVAEARTYFENRAVVWRDAQHLIWIDAAGDTRERDLATGATRLLVDGEVGPFGWLPNPELTHATTGSPTFSLYDPRTGKVAERAFLGGCQPYFSRDGRWGYWVAGAGGPLNRMELATRRIETILEKNDPLMGEGFGYAYFPMLSPDGRLFAWAASPGEHDHFRGNYEVFVAETDPATLEVLGPAVRFTSSPASDRFPDVFLEPLALGRHFGEAPFTARFAPDDSAGSWRWDFGDGTTAESPTAEHTWAKPGRYAVRARRGSTELTGTVAVAEAAPPKPAAVSLRERGTLLTVVFDEKVDLDSVEAALESGHPVAGWRAGDDGRTLLVELASALDRPDRLQLDGVADRAQVPNRMAAAVLDIEPPQWPSDRDGLLFLWETGDAPNLVFDPRLGADRTWNLAASGLARLDRSFAMTLDGGSYVLERAEAGALREALQATNELTLELVLRPGPRRQGAAGNVVTFGGTGRQQNFRLAEYSGKLSFAFRVHGSGPGAEAGAELFPVPADAPTHVVVTYTPGRLVAFRDGESAVERTDLVGNFFPWRDQALVFGDQWGGGAAWSGKVEGVAIYNRVLPPDEVRENHLRYRQRIERRPTVLPTVVAARLLSLAPVPTLSQITPYREALLVAEWEVLESAGDAAPPAGSKVRAAHWSILDGTDLAINRARPGEVFRIAVEPFADNPQLESLFLSDLPGAPAAGPLLYAPDPRLEPASPRRATRP
jgi:hypothetical protein